MTPLSDPNQLSFPVLVCPKIDGVPCAVSKTGRVVTEYPSQKLHDVLGGLPPMIGTLVVGRPDAADVLEVTAETLKNSSAPEFTFYVHDCATQAPLNLSMRMDLVESYANSCGAWVQLVAYTRLRTVEGLLEYTKAQRELGYPGVIVRNPYDAEDYLFTGDPDANVPDAEGA